MIGLTIYCRFDTDMSFSRSLTNYFRSMTMLWKALLIPVFLAWEERVPGWARTTEELTLFFFCRPRPARVFHSTGLRGNDGAICETLPKDQPPCDALQTLERLWPNWSRTASKGPERG